MGYRGPELGRDDDDGRKLVCVLSRGGQRALVPERAPLGFRPCTNAAMCVQAVVRVCV